MITLLKSFEIFNFISVIFVNAVKVLQAKKNGIEKTGGVATNADIDAVEHDEQEEDLDGQEIKQDDDGDEEMDKSRKSKGHKLGKKFKEDIEYGVSRGVDFRGIKNVLNMDFPKSAKQYVHRSGRTARGHSAGISLSLVCDADNKVIEDINTLLGPNQIMTPYAFKVCRIIQPFSSLHSLFLFFNFILHLLVLFFNI